MQYKHNSQVLKNGLNATLIIDIGNMYCYNYHMKVYVIQVFNCKIKNRLVKKIKEMRRLK